MDEHSPRPADPRAQRLPGDGWVECSCGARHWGLHGAAGLMLWRAAGAGTVDVVLQHRALWSHHGGTWGLPGGAIATGESALEGAVREATEEAGIDPTGLRVHATRRLTHPDWSYTTVLAEATADQQVSATDPESLDIAWRPLADTADLTLLPAFADSLAELSAMTRRLVLVIDGANVVGSRPDGWWSDRAGAALALRDHLGTLAAQGLRAADVGLPGERWYPHIVLVTEGQARGVGSVAGVDVIEAPGEGDDTIAAQAAALAADPRNEVLVATADRELIERARQAGARPLSPRLVRH